MRVDSEKDMKYAITRLNHSNGLVMFSNSILGNYFFNTFFVVFEAKKHDTYESYAQYEVLQYTQTTETNYTIVDDNKN